MITVRHANKNYQILFSSQQVARLDKKGLEYVEQIKCGLFADGRFETFGYAHRSPLDEPNDALGLELAFASAVGKLTKDKAVRTKFWDTFRASIAGMDLSLPEPEVVEARTPAEPAVCERALITELPSANADQIAKLEETLAKDLAFWHDGKASGAVHCTACMNTRQELATLREAA